MGYDGIGLDCDCDWIVIGLEMGWDGMGYDGMDGWMEGYDGI